MDKILQEIKYSEERLQTCIEGLEGRFGKCHGPITRRKEFTPPLEVRVDVLRTLATFIVQLHSYLHNLTLYYVCSQLSVYF